MNKDITFFVIIEDTGETVEVTLNEADELGLIFEELKDKLTEGVNYCLIKKGRWGEEYCHPESPLWYHKISQGSTLLMQKEKSHEE